MDIGAGIIGIMAALIGGGIGSLVMAWIARRKAPSEIALNAAETKKKEAEEAEIVSRVAVTVTEFLEKRLITLREENEKMREEIQSLQELNTKLRNVQQQQQLEICELQKNVEKLDEVLIGAHLLYGQVVEMNGEPKYSPPERRKP